MATIAEIRSQYPQYSDLSDAQLADALHRKFYSDMPQDEFNKKISLGAQQNETNMAADAAKSVGVGLAEGAIGLAGMPGDIRELASTVTSAIGNKLGISPRNIQGFKNVTSSVFQNAPIIGGVSTAPTSSDIRHGVENYTGEFYKPQTVAGEYANTVGQFAPAALLGPGSLAKKAISQTIIPALASETAGQITKGTGFEPYARLAGAVGGAAIPSITRRAVTPLPISAERAKAVQSLKNEGVTDITAGQATGREPLRYFEAERGRGSNLMETQAEQFTAAALRRAGIDANRATPEVMDQAFTRIGNQFDSLASRNIANVDRSMINNVNSAIKNYTDLVAPPNRAPVVENFVTELSNAIQKNAGQIPGDIYQSLRSRMEAAARGLSRNPEAQMAVREIKNAMDGAMERSIARTNPSDLGAWRNVRREYKNMLVLEKAATSAGENAAEGIISPRALRQATLSQGRRAYARGKGDFAELARAGVNILSPLPNSGTPGRLAAQNLGAGFLSMIGAGGGAAAGGPAGAALGTVIGAAAPRVLGRIATSSIGRQYLANQRLLPPVISNLPQRALLDAILASQGQRMIAPSSQ